MVNNGFFIPKDVLRSVKGIKSHKIQDMILGCAFRRAFGLEGPKDMSGNEDPSGLCQSTVEAIASAAEEYDSGYEAKKLADRLRKQNRQSDCSNGFQRIPTESNGIQRSPTDSNGVQRRKKEGKKDKKDNPPLSPKGGEPPSMIDNPTCAGFPYRAPAPISREKCIGLSSDPYMSVQVPEEFIAAWWDEHDHDGWIDEDGRAIKGMRRVRQLLAGAFNFKKNNSARVVEFTGNPGADQVFDPSRCE